MANTDPFQRVIEAVKLGHPWEMQYAKDRLAQLGDAQTPEAQALREALASREGIYRIAACRREELDARVAKINKRAAKLEQPDITVELLYVEQEPVTMPCDACLWNPAAPCQVCNGTRRVPTATIKEWQHVKLHGLAPVVEGYVFLCRLEHTEAGNFLARAAQDPKHEIPVPIKYRTAKSDCDHCQIRRQRNDTFVLFRLEGQKPEEVVVTNPETDPRYVQVGRNCLADFIRNPERVAEVVGIFNLLYEITNLVGGGEDDDDAFSGGGWGSGRYQGFDILHFLAAAVSCIRQRGWVSAAMARDQDATSTGSKASFVCSPCFSRERSVLAEWRQLQPTEADYEKAKLVRDWILALKAKEESTGQPLSDYQHNLVLIAARGLVEHRQIGLAASAVNGYDREQNRLAAASAAAKYPPSQFFGKEGDKFGPIKVTVTGKFSTSSDLAYVEVRTIIKLRAETGEIFVWFASGERQIERGQQYMLSGKVKRHNTYMEERQTVLDTRSRPTLDPLTVCVAEASDSTHDYRAILRADDSVVVEHKTKRSKKFKMLAMCEWSPEQQELSLMRGYALPEGQTTDFLGLLAVALVKATSAAS
jgi:hypothetical protein